MCSVLMAILLVSGAHASPDSLPEKLIEAFETICLDRDLDMQAMRAEVEERRYEPVPREEVEIFFRGVWPAELKGYRLRQGEEAYLILEASGDQMREPFLRFMAGEQTRRKKIDPDKLFIDILGGRTPVEIGIKSCSIAFRTDEFPTFFQHIDKRLKRREGVRRNGGRKFFTGSGADEGRPGYSWQWRSEERGFIMVAEPLNDGRTGALLKSGIWIPLGADPSTYSLEDE